MSDSSTNVGDSVVSNGRGSGHTPPIFLEGPTTDTQGNLFVVDVGQGRILRCRMATKTWELVVDYDGEPNGLALNHEGQLLVADYKNGIASFLLSRMLRTLIH